jgi:thiol-disulfide isomerase/thioredoxin
MIVRRILSLLRAFAASLPVVVACHAAPPAAGDTPPPYVGKTVDGDPVLLTDTPGKAVVVSYWATWCTYCVKELPILAGMQKAAGRENLRVIAVDTESRDVFRKLVRGLGTLDLQLAYDPDEKGREAFGVKGIPHMVIVGRDGKIAAVFRGYGEDKLDDIAAAINQAIAANQKE